MTTRADEIAERAVFLARTFGGRGDGINGHSNYFLEDTTGRMRIFYTTDGSVTITINNYMALQRLPLRGICGIYNGFQDDLCELLGVPAEVAI